jgi:hypothetical protein
VGPWWVAGMGRLVESAGGGRLVGQAGGVPVESTGGSPTGGVPLVGGDVGELVSPLVESHRWVQESGRNWLDFGRAKVGSEQTPGGAERDIYAV